MIGYELNSSTRAVLKGSIKAGPSDALPQEVFHTLVFSAEKNETGISLTAAEDNTEIILVRS